MDESILDFSISSNSTWISNMTAFGHGLTTLAGKQDVFLSSHEDVPAEVKTSPLISNFVKQILEFVFQIGLFIAISLSGIAVNIINIIVYKRQGLQDSITLGFFALSVSDLIVVICPLVLSSCYAAKFILPNAQIDFVVFHYVSTGRLRQMANSFSNILIASLSIERCCCVVMPFKVKSLFTRKRTLMFILSTLFIHIICYIPIFSTNQIRWIKDPKRNDTLRLSVWFAPNRKEVTAFNFTLMAIITPTVSQVLVICSSAVLINGLRAASKFRQMAKGASEEKEGISSGLSGRDARLAKAMVFLGCILSACNLPYLCLIYGVLFEPELSIGKAYENMYSVISSISFILASVNASVNIFVYYNTSTRYRQICREILSCKAK